MENLYHFLVNEYLQISLGQIIVLSGLVNNTADNVTSDLDLIEELAIMIRKRGAFPVLDLASKRLKLRILEETPEDKYFVPTDYYVNWVNSIDVIIDLTFPEIRNIYTDNYFTSQKKELINRSLHTIYKNMLIAEKLVLLPNFPKQSIAEYYQIDLAKLKTFYLNTFESIESKMNVKGTKIINHICPGETYFLKDSNNEIKVTVADQQCYFVNNKISNLYTVLPFGYVSLSVDKSSLDGVFKASKLYYKNYSMDSVLVTFSFGNVLSIQFENNENLAEIIKVGLINSKERVEFFIGVNNGVSEHCNYNYYDRCIDNNYSLIFYDDMNNTIELSSVNVELTNLNKKNILL